MSSSVQIDQQSAKKPAITIPALPKPNPILFALGSDKKKPTLAHEHGNGSPCTKCRQVCPGLDLHYWRKICKNCKCSKDDHDIPPAETDPGKLRIGKLFDNVHHTVKFPSNRNNSTNGASTPEKNGTAAAEKTKFDWIPPNTTQTLVEKFMANLPEQNRPISDSEGATKRRLAIERQLPLHDYDSSACHDDLNEDETKCLKKFVTYFKKNSIGQGEIKLPESIDKSALDSKQLKDDKTYEDCDYVWKCYKCEGKMQPGEVAVFAERAGPKACWHPGCFVCSECKDLLADLIYFYKDAKIYCGRHFGNLMFPRCAGCDELIFAKEYTMAEERSWHVQHFCCYSCDTHLGGERYMCKNDQPYCLKCYKLIFARTCEFCREKIDADIHRVSHDDLHWHATAECFFCCCCKIDLLKQRYVLKNGKIFCSIECKNKILSS